MSKITLTAQYSKSERVSIFKDSCKRRLQVMKYIPEEEGNYTATFLAGFRSLCNDAKIYHEEIKILLFSTYSSNEFSRNEILKSVDGLNQMYHHIFL